MFGNILGGLASGVLGLIGGRQNNAANANAADKANDFNWDAMLAQQDFGREMTGRQEAFQTGSTAKQMDFGREVIGRQEDFQRQSQQTQMDFQTGMSNTAYQRAMADMRAAGLNPMLAYGQGGATSPAGSAQSGASASASAPTGATASSSAPQAARPTFNDYVTPALSSALRGAQMVQELDNMKAQEQLIHAQTGQTWKEAGVSQNRVNQIAEQGNLQFQQARESQYRRDSLLPAQTGLVRQQASTAQASEAQQREETQDFRNWGPQGGWRSNLRGVEAIIERLRALTR